MQIQMYSQLEDHAGSIPFFILWFEFQHNIYNPLRVVIQGAALPLLSDTPHSPSGFGSEHALRYLQLTL